MSMLTERLQVLIEQAQRQRLEREAAARGTSVATLVREAIELAFPTTSDEKRRAADVILSASAGWAPDDPSDIKRMTDEEHDRWE